MQKKFTLRKAMSMILALTIVLGMMSSMSLVASADASLPDGGTTTPYIYVEADGFNKGEALKNSTWTNKGTGNDLTVLNPNGTAMAATEKTFSNGKKSVLLTGIRMGENVTSKTTPYTFIMLAKNDGNWGNTAGGAVFFTGTSGSNGLILWGEKDGEYKFAYGKNVNNKSSVGYAKTKGWRVIAGTVDSTNGFIAYENGVKVGAKTTVDKMDTVTQWGIGANANDNRHAEFASVLIYESALTPEEIKSVSDGLLKKYLGVNAVSAVAEANGETIKLTLSALPEILPSVTDFTLMIDDTEQALGTVAAVDGETALTLTLPDGVTIPYGSTVNLTSKTGLISECAGLSVDISAIENPSGIIPSIVAANICVRGKEIVLKTDVQCVVNSETDFTEFVVKNGEEVAANVTNITVKGKFIYLTLDKELPYNNADLVLSDVAGNIVSAAGGLALPITEQALVWYTDTVIPEDGLDLWLESDYGVTADETTGVLSKWEDKTGKYTFAGTTNQTDDITSYTKKTIAGVNKPVIGSNMEAAKIAVDYEGDWTWIVLAKPHTMNTSGNAALGSLGNAIIWRINNSENMNVQLGGGSQQSMSIAERQEGLPMRMLALSYSNSKCDIYSDNEEKRTVSKNGSNDPAKITQYQIGGAKNNKEDYAAFMVYHRALSEAEIQSVYQYLYEKYLMNDQNQYAVTSSYVVDEETNVATVTTTVKRRSVKGRLVSNAIIASYDVNQLKDVDYTELTLPLWNKNFMFHDIELADTPDIRVFTWHTFEDLTPLADVVNSVQRIE